MCATAAPEFWYETGTPTTVSGSKRVKTSIDGLSHIETGRPSPSYVTLMLLTPSVVRIGWLRQSYPCVAFSAPETAVRLPASS